MIGPLQGKVNVDWEPKYNEVYWCIFEDDKSVSYYVNTGTAYDARRIDSGNVFRTEKEAEEYRDHGSKVFLSDKEVKRMDRLGFVLEKYSNGHVIKANRSDYEEYLSSGFDLLTPYEFSMLG